MMIWVLFVLLSEVFLIVLSSDGPVLVSNGVGTLVGYGSGTAYRAQNFLPVCGILDSGFTSPFDVQQFCVAAISTYNQTAKLSGFYDQTGVELTNDMTGDGEKCFCFSLSTVNGNQANICVWLNALDQQQINDSEGIVQGSFRPGTKALPHCEDFTATSGIDTVETISTANLSFQPTMSTTIGINIHVKLLKF